MTRIGITGWTGLVGSHLKFFLEQSDKYEPILIGREEFADSKKLKKKLLKSDVIVHLAGLSNRAKQDEIFETNTGLTRQILEILENNNHYPKFIFLSSIHREKDIPYGRSKKESERLIQEWGKIHNSAIITIIISPHIFGDSPHVFDKSQTPYLNSAFATFCHDLVNGRESNVYANAPIEYIYVGDVRDAIFNASKKSKKIIHLSGTKTQMEDVYALLKYFRDEHAEGRIPKRKNNFEENCYKTFKSYF